MSIRKKQFVFWLACLLFLAGCPSKIPEPPRPVFERIQPHRLPDLRDDESAESLRSAIEKSIAWYERVPAGRVFPFGTHSLGAGALKESLTHFLALLDSGTLDSKTLAREFDIFRVVPPDRAGKMLVTGYFEPVLEGSLKPDGPYAWPLYGLPGELVTIDLERFDPEAYRGKRLVGRLEKNRVVPFYTRSEIDGQGRLAGSGAEIAWLKDPVDCFFLHVQGSGLIRLPDGGSLRVGYAGANGRPYRSIGKSLIDKGAVSKEDMSLQAIRGYLHAHPSERNDIMWQNESYVFFRIVKEGPLGSLNCVLTAGRSVASDPGFHPRGAVAFLVSEKPRHEASGQVSGWERFGRWVVNQDTGGAIKGPGRIDLFCGTGAQAERIAGPMKQPGEMYYFIKKGLLPSEG